MKEHPKATKAQLQGTRRPRILLSVTADYSLRLMRGIPNYLYENGWEVHVVTAPGVWLQTHAKETGVTYHTVPMRRDPSPFRDAIALIRWIRLCRQVRPDLISVGTPKAGLLGAVAGWLTRVPRRIYHQRGLRLETTTGFKRILLGATERIAVNCSHVVLAVSPSLKQVMVDLGLSSPEKTIVVGQGSSNGVDTDEFSPERFDEDQVFQVRADLGLRPDVPTIGFVARLHKDKGFDILEAAVNDLWAAGSDFDLLIVGGVDDSASGQTLERLLAHGRVAATDGSVADPAIYFQLMDVFCLPTYREGFPNVTLEAGASGKATVTTDATGAIDSVIPNVTGSIVPMGDSDALALELQRLIDNPRELARMGSEARAHVSEHFARPRFWKLLLSFYETQYEAGKSRANE